jgi:hypothetical protein
MKKRLLTLLLIPVLLPAEKTDNQFWHVEKLSRPINDALTVILHQDLRNRNNGKELYYLHSDLGLALRTSSTVTLGFYFREVMTRQGNGWGEEHRPYVQATIKPSLALVKFSARARLEYRILPDERKFRNRNLVTVKAGRSFTRYKLVPYVADEIFYDLEKQEMNRNRFYIGVEFGHLFQIKPTLYLMRQSSLKDGRWDYFDVLGLKFSL